MGEEPDDDDWSDFDDAPWMIHLPVQVQVMLPHEVLHPPLAASFEPRAHAEPVVRIHLPVADFVPPVSADDLAGSGRSTHGNSFRSGSARPWIGGPKTTPPTRSTSSVPRPPDMGLDEALAGHDVDVVQAAGKTGYRAVDHAFSGGKDAASHAPTGEGPIPPATTPPPPAPPVPAARRQTGRRHGGDRRL